MPLSILVEGYDFFFRFKGHRRALGKAMAHFISIHLPWFLGARTEVTMPLYCYTSLST